MHALKNGNLTRISLKRVGTLVGACAVLMGMTAVARADYTVNACGPYPNNLFALTLPANGFVQSTATNGEKCAAGGPVIELHPLDGFNATLGSRGVSQATAPAGLEIVGATVPSQELDAGGGGGWVTGPYWKGGSVNLAGNPTGGTWSGFASPFFGFQLVCTANPCPANMAGGILAEAVSLTVRETVSPSLSALSGLWQANGWVRGQWPVEFSGDSPSGVCALTGTLNGIALPGTNAAHTTVATWHQCSAPAVSTSVNTAAYGQGPMPLAISGTDAAGNVGRVSKTVDVDNSMPTLSLSGRRDAPSTAGTQFVTATAGGSPSGIANIVCSVDDGQLVATYAGARARVPVSGLGEHQVSCTAYNNAVDPNGDHGASQTQTRSIKIGTPTALAITASRLARIRCSKIAAGRVKCDLKHRRVRVLVRVPLKRHGKIVYRTRVERRNVIALPGNVTKRVGHGRTTTVSGWLGLADGTPLAGETVEVLAAPDNGLVKFTPAAEATTAPNGTWTAALPAGPSRLIEASYAGTATTQQSMSGQATLLVPSKVKLTSVTPHHVAWGQTVTIKGQLLDGYLPNAGINVRLRIGIARAKTTFGVKEHVAGSGRFTATFRFGPGSPQTHRTYWFQIASLPAGDYPYTPSASNRIYVQVGGHPA